MGSDMGSDTGADIDDATPAAIDADIDGEPWTEYHELDDEGWETLKPFLPETMGEDRALISGVLWVFTTRESRRVRARP